MKTEDNYNNRNPETDKPNKTSKISQYVKDKKGATGEDKGSKLLLQETGEYKESPSERDLLSELYETPSEKNNRPRLGEVQKPSTRTRSVISEVDENDSESPDDTSEQPGMAKGKSPADTSGQLNIEKVEKQNHFSKNRVKQKRNTGSDKKQRDDKEQSEEDTSFKKPISTTVSRNLQDSGDKKAIPNSLNKKSPNQQWTQVIGSGKFHPRTESRSESSGDVVDDNDDGDEEEEEEEVDEEECVIPHDNLTGPHKHTRRKTKNSQKEGGLQHGNKNSKKIKNNVRTAEKRMAPGDSEFQASDKNETPSEKNNSGTLGEVQKPTTGTRSVISEVDDIGSESPDGTSGQPDTEKGKNRIKQRQFRKNRVKPKTYTGSDKTLGNDKERPEEDTSFKKPVSMTNSSSQQESGDRKTIPNSLNRKSPNQQRTQVLGSGRFRARTENRRKSPDDVDDDNEDEEEEEEVDEEECVIPHDNLTGPHKHTRRKTKDSKLEGGLQLGIKNSKKLNNDVRTAKKQMAPDNSEFQASDRNETRLQKNNSGTLGEVQKPTTGTRSVISEVGDIGSESSDGTSGQPNITKGKNRVKQRQFRKNRVKPKTYTGSDKTLGNDKERSEEDTSLKKPVSMTLSSNQHESGDKKTIPNNLNKNSSNQQVTQVIRSGKFEPRTENKRESSDEVVDDKEDDDEEEEEEEEVDEEECVIPHDNLTGPHKHTKRKNKNAKVEGGLQLDNKNSKKLKNNFRTIDNQLEPGNSGLQVANEPSHTLNDYVYASHGDTPATESDNSRNRKNKQQAGKILGSKSPGRQNSGINSNSKILPYTKNKNGISDKYGKNKVEEIKEEEEEDDDDDDDEEEEEVEEEECIIPHTRTTEPHKHTKNEAKLKEFDNKQKLIAEDQNEPYTPQQVLQNKKLSLKGNQNVKFTAQNPESDETYTEESPRLKANSSQKRSQKLKRSKLKYNESLEASGDVSVENIENSSGHGDLPSSTKSAEKTQNSQSYEIGETGEANSYVDTSVLPTSARRSLVYPEYHGENNNNCYGSTPSSGSTPLDSYKTRQGYKENQDAMYELDPRAVTVDIDDVIVEDPKFEDSDTNGEGTNQNSKPVIADSSCKPSQSEGTQSQSTFTGGNGMGVSPTGANSNWMTGSTSGRPAMPSFTEPSKLPFFSMAPFMYATGFPESSKCKPQKSSAYSKMQPFMYHKSPMSKNKKYGQRNNNFKTNPQTYAIQSAKSWTAPGTSGGVKCQVQTSSSGPSSFRAATYKHPFTKKK